MTRLCRDSCHYCTFATAPQTGRKAYLTADEVLAIAKAGETTGCTEALFTLGDKPELRYKAAREELASLGCTTTIDYLVRMCALVLEDTGLLPHQIAGQMLPASVPTAVLSGPTFAREVGAGLPTAMTIASADLDFAQRLAETISTDTFRAYTSTDIAGVEVGGATKNVYAIGAGICDGLGFGANTRIALIAHPLLDIS